MRFGCRLIRIRLIRPLTAEEERITNPGIRHPERGAARHPSHSTR
jgi:hypothetical protein